MALILMTVMVFSLGQATAKAMPVSQDQKQVESSASALALKNLHEKDLFKRAEASMQKQDFEDAFNVFVVVFEKRQQKPHKKYSPLFEKVSQDLAKKEVEKGREALAGNNLDICERHIVAAKSRLQPLGLKGEEVISLERSLNEKKAEIMSRFDKAKAQAAATDFEGALKTFHSLEAYEKYVPDLKGAILQTDRSYIGFLIDSAQKSSVRRSWDEAISFFQQAQLKDPDNAAVKTGLANVDRGKTADSLNELSLKQLSESNFKEAMRSIEKAIGNDPDFIKLAETKKSITSGWIQNLESRIPALLANKSNFQQTRDGYLELETLRRLRQDHPLIKENLQAANQMLAGNSLERANEISQDPSKEFSATAYALLLNAKARSQAGFVQEDDLKNAASYFNRKRFSQVVVSVENESSAPESFVSSIRTRAINTVENLGLSDLKVITREQYNTGTEVDAVFGNLRVDGKPSTVMLTIRVDKYFSDLEATEKQLESEYLFQTKEITNPVYEKKRTEQDQFWEEVRKGSKKVKSNERSQIIDSHKRELEAIPKTISEPELRKYNYREITHTRTTQVRLVLSLKDPLNNESLSSDTLDYPNKYTKKEIAGVHEKDTHGILNQPLVAPPTKEQALSQAERSVSDDLELKLPKMITPFTERFLNEGKRWLASQQTAKAVENFLCHWAIAKGRVASAEDAALIQETVKQETTYDLNQFNQDFFSLVAPIRSGR